MTAQPAAHLRVVTPDETPVKAKPVRQLATSWTADQLMGMHFPEPRWAVPGLLPEGVSLLAGPPKVGKSWLSLATALAIAAGGRAFGTIDVKQGPVLYLALEDTARRLQSRMRILLDGQPAPAGLTLATTCPPLPAGGDQAIAHWLDRHKDARMVVIDVFAKMRGNSAPGASAYDADYAAVGRAKKIADDYGVAVVLVHHVRKAGADDFLAEVSGTNGIAGAADTTLVLKRGRGSADGVLHITGRDVDESEHAMTFDPAKGAWTLLAGNAEQHIMHDTRATIARYLTDTEPATPKAIAYATGLSYDQVKKTCQRMTTDGQLRSDASGRYTTPNRASTVPGVPAVPQQASSSTNSIDHEGHLGDNAVPAVPEVEGITR